MLYTSPNPDAIHHNHPLITPQCYIRLWRGIEGRGAPTRAQRSRRPRMQATAEPRNPSAFQCLVLLSIGEQKSRFFKPWWHSWWILMRLRRWNLKLNETNRLANANRNKQKTNKQINATHTKLQQTNKYNKKQKQLTITINKCNNRKKRTNLFHK